MRNLDLYGSFFNGRRVLVTGHTGFKGTWLCLWLRGLRAQVTGYSLGLPTRPSLFADLGLAADVRHYIGDVRDPVRLARVFAAARPELVFHLAAQSLVLPSYRAPRQTYETNVMGTVNLLEAVRHCRSVRAVVNVTSDKCYQNREQPRGYREVDALGGHDPYSSSKGCAELVTAAYRWSFFAPNGGTGKQLACAVASARAGNVIGGGDWAEERLLPDCVRALLAERAVTVRCPDAVRPWQYVLEPLAGYLLLARRLYEEGAPFTEAWNFGPERAAAASVRRVVADVIRLWGCGSCRVLKGRRPHEASQLRLNSAKARAVLGWRPGYGLSQALEQTIAWYRFYQRHGRCGLREFSVSQIYRYAAAVRKRNATHGYDRSRTR